MSFDVNISDSISSKVTSKYFASETGMDESLSDFQEKKKITGSKKHIKLAINKSKSKRAPKRPRGQKDIRTALLSKKNDLVSYTKDFDTVCKQSGIDVDSQELQLAVALSKSLHPPDDYDSETIQTGTQERTVRIRTTLQEYGFVVPAAKIKNAKRKFAKHRKNCKLLSLTEAEKQQSITDKYSQVLFQNLDCSKSPVKKNKCSNINAKLYYLTTNADFEIIKNNDSFYVNNLSLEKSSNKGCLLKDWAEIPGRPVSPKQSRHFTMDVSEIDCSQGELDVVLSGALKSAQNITKLKMKEVPNVHCIMINSNAKTDSHMNLDNKVEYNADDNVTSGTLEETVVGADCNLEDSVQVKNQIEFQGLCSELNSSKTVRCGSPDLFDDESPSIFINSEDIQSPVSVSKLHNVYYKEPVDCEEKCEKVCDILSNSSQVFHSVESEAIDVLKLSQSNVTKRRSNDMEITECIATSLHHPLLQNKSLTHYDSTKFKTNDFMDLTECVPHSSQQIIKNTVIDINIDLTQIQDDDGDDLIGQEEPVTEKPLSRNIEDVDLTQSSNSIDDLPFIEVSCTNKRSEDTVILNDKDISTFIKLATKDTLETEVITINENNDEVILDLIDETNKNNRNVKNSSNSDSFDEFLYDHSDDVEDHDDKSDIISSPPKDEQKNESHAVVHKIDLTQSTSSHEEAEQRSHNLIDTPNNETELCNKSSLGKIDDVSVDYDEVISNMNQDESNSDDQNANSKSNTLTDNYDEKHMDTSTQSSQECEAFAISDKELDYSLQKNAFEQPDINFGGISIMDDISHIQMANSNETVSNYFKQSHDSFLPSVNVKSTNNSQPTNCEMNTPCKEINIRTTVKTPSNREYLIKTDNVTPMSDFASMSTPERNQELDKYGLKPLKRKRAIQLLTHIYNQTHPILETHSHDELQSPSKKQKTESSTSKSLKQVKPPGEKTEVEKCDGMMENIYEITNEIIDVRDIECSADDWVFQKREKAKVHSCRVPLHIAFYNYVSCRRWLREAILRYEPVNIDVIHKDLVANGFKYDPKDLLKFLDKKCITVKTADNSSRNNRR